MRYFINSESSLVKLLFNLKSNLRNIATLLAKTRLSTNWESQILNNKKLILYSQPFSIRNVSIPLPKFIYLISTQINKSHRRSFMRRESTIGIITSVHRFFRRGTF